MMKKLHYLLLVILFLTNSCYSQSKGKSEKAEKNTSIVVGAERMDLYVPLLKDKKVAIVGNQTSQVKGIHLVDTLLRCGISIAKIMTPEHGFRGTADAGAHVADGVDDVTGLPLVSLYGSHKKPTAEDLKGIDMVVFDIQDVGARFYTYISTMHYVMEACAEQYIPMVILDRPNPNGFYVDGPILQVENKSFVGMHPVPIVHGMTIGEYAGMINGEQWLANGVQCKLYVVECEGYDHTKRYELPIAPSPNLPNMQAIYLYPTLCLFEGTVMSCARGTDFPFQAIGCPTFADKSFSFVPRSKSGASSPKYKDETCYGRDFQNVPIDSFGRLDIDTWIDLYKNYTGTKPFFISFFTKLAGTAELQKMIESGKTSNEIRATWADGLKKFKQMRQKYLLYADF